jgi:hypothetical protein
MPDTIDRIRHKLLDRDENFLGIITGKTGIGKSGCALKIAEMVNPDFTIDNLVFSARDFMDLMKNPEMKKGNVIIWDEIGVGQVGGYGSGGLASREFMTTTNKILNYFLQGFRAMNICVLFTLPSLSMLDIQTRNLAHGIWVCIKRNEKYVTTKYFEVEHNPIVAKTYHKYQFSEDSKQIKRVYIEPPSTILWHKYLKKKKIWLEELRAGVTAKLALQDKMESKDNITPFKDMAIEMEKKFPDMKPTGALVRTQYPELSYDRALVVVANWKILRKPRVIV